jgi:mono/diheme cytochrome c family protein
MIRGLTMNRLRFFLPALVSLLGLVWSTAARSDGDPVRGNALYHDTYHCTDCHLATPTVNLKSGVTAQGILNAIMGEGVMNIRYANTLAQNPVDLADLAAYIASVLGPPAPPPGPPGAILAVEYYYADWNFYFETSFSDEIAGLDAGAYGGVWKRTGQTFYVWPTADANPLGVATCRFFTVFFAPKSSHFYTPNADECAGLQATSQVWQFESIAFYIALIDANGNCPPGTIPLYRFYDNGMGGAPNHRYTTSLTVFNDMVGQGWQYEGHPVTKVFACVPG